MFDWNCVKLWVNEQVSVVFGCLFVINGDFKVGWCCFDGEIGWCVWVFWLSFLVIQFEIGNFDWVKVFKFVMFDVVYFDFVILLLLVYEIVILLIDVVNFVVDFEWCVDGINMWIFQFK